VDPKIDADSWNYPTDYDDFNHRPCDKPDPECLCDRCRRERGELS
jgi:hypothetical protein